MTKGFERPGNAGKGKEGDEIKLDKWTAAQAEVNKKAAEAKKAVSKSESAPKNNDVASEKKGPTIAESITDKLRRQADESAEKEIIAEMARRREAGESTQLESGITVVMTKEEKQEIRDRVFQELVSERSRKMLDNIANKNSESAAPKSLEQWEQENPDKIKEYKAGAKEQAHQREIDELKAKIDAAGGDNEGAANLLNEKFNK